MPTAGTAPSRQLATACFPSGRLVTAVDLKPESSPGQFLERLGAVVVSEYAAVVVAVQPPCEGGPGQGRVGCRAPADLATSVGAQLTLGELNPSRTLRGTTPDWSGSAAAARTSNAARVSRPRRTPSPPGRLLNPVPVCSGQAGRRHCPRTPRALRHADSETPFGQTSPTHVVGKLSLEGWQALAEPFAPRELLSWGPTAPISVSTRSRQLVVIAHLGFSMSRPQLAVAPASVPQDSDACY